MSWTTTLSERFARLAIALLVALGLPFLVLTLFVHVAPSRLLTSWNFWIPLLIIGYLIGGPRVVETQAAGADWFLWQFKKRWFSTGEAAVLHLYDLTEISWESDGALFFLTLTDRQGTTCSRQRLDYQQDRRIWDLVYNGILHSVVHNKADITHAAREFLLIDETLSGVNTADD